MAPLALDGKIIVGISGGEAGIRGFLDAYDPKTGKLRWRFWTIPGTGRARPRHLDAATSWKNGARRRPGSPAPTTPSLNLLYWGTGNPGPGLERRRAAGRQPLHLRRCSRSTPTTGKMKWHFQYTPHDVHDWDANQIQVLLDAPIGGRPRRCS